MREKEREGKKRECRFVAKNGKVAKNEHCEKKRIERNSLLFLLSLFCICLIGF
jgi:hypothetical protein